MECSRVFRFRNHVFQQFPIYLVLTEGDRRGWIFFLKSYPFLAIKIDIFLLWLGTWRFPWRELLLSSAHSLKEGDEGHESFIISGFTELLHQGLGLLLGHLLSEVGQQTEELVGKHGVVVVFVVELEDLNKVVESP